MFDNDLIVSSTSNLSWLDVCGNNHLWIDTHGIKTSVEGDSLTVEQTQYHRTAPIISISEMSDFIHIEFHGNKHFLNI